jgi:hypothetical protein
MNAGPSGDKAYYGLGRIESRPAGRYVFGQLTRVATPRSLALIV